MWDALYAAFAGTGWPLALLAYFLVGFAVGGATGGGRSRFMTALGWPLELTQRLAGTTGLPYLFLVPNLLVFGLFTFSPMFINVGFSVTEGQSILFEQRDWAGGENLTRLLSETNPDTGGENREDDKFLAAVADTFVFVIFQVPIMVLIALVTALVLNREIIGRGFWRSVFFYPVMLSPVVVGFLWTLILKRQGVLSLTLMQWGWIDEPIQWLTDPSWTMFWSVFVYTWAHLGFYMLILLAGLQAIPKDLYEAAQMDGTSDWRVLWRITLPLLMPTLLVVMVLSLIKAFQAFEELYAMQVRWTSLVAYIFETSGLRGQPTANGLGVAATASLLVAIGLILLSLIQIYLTSRQNR
ncbi:carbohydrate ABC transporter permease [Primorskyibacter sp. S187A]|uniref:carbohydrate ABC transporter permease n=1 Tax=Primorskyibacter sp. S187A TaxID=3415130 RepID=UPI003C7C40C5